MSRSVDERVRDVRRWLDAARAVHADRARHAAAIAASTGLSLEGVEVGFDCLERDATTAELRALVASAGDAASVHVILSAERVRRAPAGDRDRARRSGAGHRAPVVSRPHAHQRARGGGG